MLTITKCVGQHQQGHDKQQVLPFYLGLGLRGKDYFPLSLLNLNRFTLLGNVPISAGRQLSNTVSLRFCLRCSMQILSAMLAVKPRSGGQLICCVTCQWDSETRPKHEVNTWITLDHSSCSSLCLVTSQLRSEGEINKPNLQKQKREKVHS